MFYQYNLIEELQQSITVTLSGLSSITTVTCAATVTKYISSTTQVTLFSVANTGHLVQSGSAYSITSIFPVRCVAAITQRTGLQSRVNINFGCSSQITAYVNVNLNATAFTLVGYGFVGYEIVGNSTSFVVDVHPPSSGITLRQDLVVAPFAYNLDYTVAATANIPSPASSTSPLTLRIAANLLQENLSRVVAPFFLYSRITAVQSDVASCTASILNISVIAKIPSIPAATVTNLFSVSSYGALINNLALSGNAAILPTSVAANLRLESRANASVSVLPVTSSATLVQSIRLTAAPFITDIYVTCSLKEVALLAGTATINIGASSTANTTTNSISAVSSVLNITPSVKLGSYIPINIVATNTLINVSMRAGLLGQEDRAQGTVPVFNLSATSYCANYATIIATSNLLPVSAVITATQSKRVDTVAKGLVVSSVGIITLGNPACTTTILNITPVVALRQSIQTTGQATINFTTAANLIQTNTVTSTITIPQLTCVCVVAQQIISNVVVPILTVKTVAALSVPDYLNAAIKFPLNTAATMSMTSPITAKSAINFQAAANLYLIDISIVSPDVVHFIY